MDPCRERRGPLNRGEVEQPVCFNRNRRTHGDRFTQSATTSSLGAQEAALDRLCDSRAACVERSRRSPTFARLHYHGPGGLNGRVRDGNGCDPAGMVAGKAAGGRSRHAGRNSSGVRWSVTRSSWFTATPFEQGKWARSHLTSDQNLNQNPESMSMPDVTFGVICDRLSSTFGSVSPPRIGRLRLLFRRRADRGGQAARLLGPVG